MAKLVKLQHSAVKGKKQMTTISPNRAHWLFLKPGPSVLFFCFFFFGQEKVL